MAKNARLEELRSRKAARDKAQADTELSRTAADGDDESAAREAWLRERRGTRKWTWLLIACLACWNVYTLWNYGKDDEVTKRHSEKSKPDPLCWQPPFYEQIEHAINGTKAHWTLTFDLFREKCTVLHSAVIPLANNHLTRVDERWTLRASEGN